jgi:hypothetical protein
MSIHRRSVCASAVLTLACLGSSIPGISCANTVENGGNIINQTWNVAGSPYVVNGDVTIPVGSTLAIAAGTVIQVAPTDGQQSGVNPNQVEMTVRGTLNVTGTPASPVQFLTTTGSFSTSPSLWYGVVANSGSNLSLSNAQIDGNLYLNSGANYNLALTSPANLGTNSVAGALTLGGNLDLTLNLLNPQAGQVFTLFQDGGTTPVSGIFTGLPQGSLIPAGSADLALSYAGGDGNDVTLTVTNPAPVPLPASAFLLLSGLAGLGFCGARRPRNRGQALLGLGPLGIQRAALPAEEI